MNTTHPHLNIFAAARCFAFITLALLLPLIVVAQTNLGGITGTVTDQNGAVVPGATVIVIDVGTNRSVTLTTSDDGAYTATLLQPTFYRVTVEAANFKRKIVEAVKVDTATTTTTNVVLEVGGTEDTVTVTAESPILNTESGATSQTIVERQIRDLPVSNRSVLELAVTVPNVSGEPGSEDPQVTTGIPTPGAALNLNGGRPGETTILADGVSNTGIGIARQVVSFTPDVVQEFTVQTSSFSAEYGQTGGGVINTTTKSGTNDFRGTLYWYHRNPYVAAAPFTTNTANRPLNEVRQNNFGLIIGGPIFMPKFGEGGPRVYNGRNRSFFFFAFEPRYSGNSIPSELLQPTDAMRRGDFSNAVSVPGGIADRTIAQRMGITNITDIILYRQFELVGGQLQRLSLQPGQTYPRFENNIIPPEYLDPVSLRILQNIPLAGENFIAAGGNLRNYATTRRVRNNERRYTLRLDHSLTANNKLSGRFNEVPIFGERLFGPQELVFERRPSDFSASRAVVIGDTHTFSPTIINDLKLNYTRGNYTRTNPPEFQTRNLSTELGLPSGTAAGLPQFLAGAGSVGQTDIGELRDNIEETFNISNTISIVRGNQTLKIGADLRHQRQKLLLLGTYQGGEYNFGSFLTNDNGLTSGGTGGLTFATFLLGVPSNINLRSAVVPYYYRWNSASFFIQDDWKVRPNLTFNLGLRYSLQLPRTEKYDRQGSFRPELSLAVSVSQSPLRTTAAGNPAISIPAGVLPTSTQVPVFAFAGRGERSRYLTPVDKNDFEPRLGFAYSPKLLGLNGPGDRALIIRGGYGLSHSVLTGQDRFPSPDIGGTIDESLAFDSGQGVNPGLLRLSNNPPSYDPLPPDLVIPENGLVGLNSIFFAGNRFAVADDFKVPSVHSYNLSLSYEVLRNTALEVAYVGSYSRSLFFPGINFNTQSFDSTERLLAAGVNPETSILDPLGRRDPATGQIAAVRLGTITAPYLGFTNIDARYDASAKSVRHAGYVSLQRRFSSGFSLTSNYTIGKTISEASDNGNAFGIGGPGFTVTQISYGGEKAAERGVAVYDITHSFASTFLYELPFGRGRRFVSGAPGIVDALIGGWQVGGVARAQSGYPIRVNLIDSNRLGVIAGGQIGAQSRIRPDVVSGVPIVNPLYDRNCPPIGAGLCEPYVNPAAFKRPPKGQIGNAPRTISNARWPGQENLDVSLQKNFRIFGEGRRYLQLRADVFNIFNHPNLRFSPNLETFNLVGLPSENDISAAEYNNFAAANPALNLPRQVGATPNPIFQQVLNVTRSARSGGATTGPLPDDFFSVQLPQGFATQNVNSFDIRTPEGLKLYRLRSVYNNRFGTFDPNIPTSPESRTITFALKFYF